MTPDAGVRWLMKTDDSGFTLIELLIVVVIIGILAAIAIPKFSATREQAYLASLKSDLKNLAMLQDVYYNDNYSYSTSFPNLEFVSSDGVTVTIGEANNLGWSASSAHAGLSGESCALYHGGATPVAPATVESKVICSR
jgi:prepilin-type N-terminal cleavage/methylation domain-containing protein